VANRSTAGLKKSISKNTVSMLRLICSFHDPVFLVSKSGSILCSNQSARKQFGEAPGWIGAAIRGDVRVAKLCPLSFDEREVFLVIPTVQAVESVTEGMLEQLPPSLERVARLLLMGLSDKEIMDYTGLSHSSVRTYASRIYQRLELTGRSELLAKALNPAGYQKK
jgi:hypothetical protein